MTLFYQSRGCIPDYCTQPGADALAKTIAAFWAARDRVVEMRLVGVGFCNSARGERVDLRSNMKNGWPA